MSNRWTATFRCDRCGTEATGKEGPHPQGYKMPSPWNHMPEEWTRSYSYDFCPHCKELLDMMHSEFRKYHAALYAAMTNESKEFADATARKIFWNAKVPKPAHSDFVTDYNRRKAEIPPMSGNES